MSEETRYKSGNFELIAHINARMMIFGGCVQTVCRQFRNKCFGYNFSHVNRSWECPIVLHFEQLVENPQLCERLW